MREAAINRRTKVLALVAFVIVVCLVSGLAINRRGRAAEARVPLFADGISVDGRGRVAIVAPIAGDAAPGGPEGRDRAADPAAREQDRLWLAAGCVPGAGGPFEDMARDALLDLHHLARPNGAVVAGWTPYWRYVWPRDASFAAVALARTGHPEDALGVLRFLQGVQDPDGTFQARYLIDGSGAPDDRGRQLDGTGWVLWAADQVVLALPPRDRQRALAGLARLVDRAGRAALDVTDAPGALPPVSGDYWEVRETSLTLGTVAPIAIGLRAAADLARLRGDGAEAAGLAGRAGRVETAIAEVFGPQGYPRHVTGGGRDAALAFLLPPFRTEARDDVVRAWQDAARGMARPAGGLAPGEDWKRDGVSWTPETALFALSAAATGDDARARAWLAWLDSHRTPMGSLPEKVLADGTPAAVAPLAWTCALVLLTLVEQSGPAGCPRV